MAPLSRERLQERDNAPLAACRITARRVVKNTAKEADSPPTLIEYLCEVPQRAPAATPGAPNGVAPPAPPATAAAAPDAVAQSLRELYARGGQPTWVVETALPLAFIKQQEEAHRGGAEYAALEGAPDNAEDWMFAGGKSSGGHSVGELPQATVTKSADSGPAEALASRRSRRNVGRKVYYTNEEEEAFAVAGGGDDGIDGSTRMGEVLQFGGEGAPEEAPPGWQDSEALTAPGAPPDGADGTRRRGAPGRRMPSPTPRCVLRAPLSGALVCSTDMMRPCAGKGGPLAAWATRAARALTQLINHPTAAPFSEPVPRSVPMYYEIIQRPMDLSTILAKLQASKYGTPADFYSDMNLVWSNCRQYNEPQSEITVMAAQLEAAWQQMCSLQALTQLAASSAPAAAAPEFSGGAGPDAASLAALQAQQQAKQQAQAQAQAQAQQQAQQLQAQRLAQQQALLRQQQAQQQQAQAAAAGGGASQQQQQQALAQMQAMAAVIARLRRCDCAAPFLEPVPRAVPGYYEAIAHPTDLGTIWTKITKGQYATASHTHAEVLRMFQNCFTFNEDGSEVFLCGKQAEEQYTQLCREARLL